MEALVKAVKILSEKGRFSAAANNQRQVAEMYETDINDVPKALEAYELAADWYQGEESNAQAQQCYLKVGMLAAQLDDYEKAIQKFELVARGSVDNNLTKWSVREHLLKAGLCILASGDLVRAKKALETYQALDVTFASTREFKLLIDLVETIEQNDVETFTNTVFDFDKLTKLDSWKTSLLLKIKRTLADDTVDFT